MKHRLFLSFTLFGLSLVSPAAAVADVEPLTLWELDAFSLFMRCQAPCHEDPACLEQCAAPKTKWDKDRDQTVDPQGVDWSLALLEYWDDGPPLEYVCYQKIEGDTVTYTEPESCDSDCRVTERGMCDAAECLAEGKTADQCKDFDDDGLHQWEEEILGTSDKHYNGSCQLDNPENNPCGFREYCQDPCDLIAEDTTKGVTKAACRELNQGNAMCLPRDCKEQGCTAFHLEQVTVNNNELIVRVWYDYSPVPAQVLDLHIKYDEDALHLIDTRPLKTLVDSNKKLYASHPRQGVLRLVVLGTSSAEEPIPNGPIVELVFDRLNGFQSTVAFATEDKQQIKSMAPDQGTTDAKIAVRDQLKDDALWGEGIQVPAADPNGPRLLLYYNFDNPNKYLSYSDVPSGTELCEQLSECTTLDDSLVTEKKLKDDIKARLNTLQRGKTSVSELIEGVIGRGAYLDGRTDHLEFPITVNEPTPAPDKTLYYDEVDQSFSLSTWFYSEGDDSLDLEKNGQILFSRNTVSELTRFGLLVRNLVRNSSDGLDNDGNGTADRDDPQEKDTIDLVWFEGDIKTDADDFIPDYTKVIATIPVREWTHVGLVLVDTLDSVDDDDDGETDEADEFDHLRFYLDGDPVEVGLPQLQGVDDDGDGVIDEDAPGQPGVDDDGDGEIDNGEKTYALPFREHNSHDYLYGDVFQAQCPWPRSAGGLHLQKEGHLMANPGSPEVLFYASAENNLFGIEQMDLNGFANTELIRDGVSAARDPDYNPIINKIVYASSQSGNYEIWIADADGANARQITKGFGDTARGIFARRPVWAPDGSAIVFDSNIYSFEHMDNWYRRVYHLYYIAYDPQKGEVAIPVEGGGILTELDYDFIATNQIIHDYRLTQSDGRNHYGAIWKEGRDLEENHRGSIWYNAATPDYEDKHIRHLLIPAVPAPKEGDKLSLKGVAALTNESAVTGDEELCNPTTSEFSMLDAYRIQPAGSHEQAQMLYRNEWSEYVEAGEFVLSDPVPGGIEIGKNKKGDPIVRPAIQVTITFDPDISALSALCWDVNGNGSTEGQGCDTEEDRNRDGKCDVHDCLPSEVPNLYLEYDAEKYVASVDYSDGGKNIESCENTDTQRAKCKDVEIGDNFTACAQSVKVRVLSEVNNIPLQAGDEIATITFFFADDMEFSDANPAFELMQRHRREALGIVDMAHDYLEAPFPIAEDLLESVTGAEFSPDGNRLVLTGIQKARPVVLVSKPGVDQSFNERGSDNTFKLRVKNPACEFQGNCELEPVLFDKISTQPMKVAGLDWAPIERYYPCNWVGGFRDEHTKLFSHGLRGGLDELRLYSYARESGAFESDADRGQAWLEKEQRQGTLESKEANCATDLDCPEYKVCDNVGAQRSNQCVIRRCDPEKADPCKGKGVCTLMPIPVGQGEWATDADGNIITDPDGEIHGLLEHHEWVCSVECATDMECFEKECLNGPCRFCDTATWSCVECAVKDHTISGNVTLTYVEGCPDRNSFACDQGSCVTECYSFENGESKYLCDPALEYCYQGRCKIFDWSWTDFAPSSFSGLGQMAYDLPELRVTTAINQLYPIEITAFGVEDFLASPQLLVEGRVGLEGMDPYNGDWFKIGSVTVKNKTRTEAGQNKYVVLSPLPVSEIRMRLIIPSAENINNGAMGYDAGKINAVCRDGEQKTCNRWQVVYSAAGAKWTCQEWKSLGSCLWRTPGSRASVGYRVGIPEHAVRRACFERGGVNCGYQEEILGPWLYGGQPTVIILDVKVNGKGVVKGASYNRVCSFAEKDYAKEAKDAVYYDDQRLMKIYRRLFFGNARREQSNQKAALYPNPGAGTPTKLRDLRVEGQNGAGSSYFVLNCNLYAEEEQNQTGVGFRVCSNKTACNVLFPTKGQVGSIKEDGVNGCTVERGMRGTPCYEWLGDETSVDCMSYMEGATEPWHSLDFDLHRSFGYDE